MSHRRIRLLTLGAAIAGVITLAGALPAGATGSNSIDWVSMTARARQTVPVAGVGFTPGISVEVRQCGDMPGGSVICNTASVVTTTVAADGTFTVGVPVRETFTGVCGSGCSRKQGHKYWIYCQVNFCDLEAISTDPFTGVAISWG